MMSIAIFAQALQIRIGWRLNPASIFASSGPVSCSILLQNEQCKFIGMLGSIAFLGSSVSTDGRRAAIRWRGVGSANQLAAKETKSSAKRNYLA
jgi:hypothetical protein